MKLTDEEYETFYVYGSEDMRPAGVTSDKWLRLQGKRLSEHFAYTIGYDSSSPDSITHLPSGGLVLRAGIISSDAEKEAREKEARRVAQWIEDNVPIVSSESIEKLNKAVRAAVGVDANASRRSVIMALLEKSGVLGLFE